MHGPAATPVRQQRGRAPRRRPGRRGGDPLPRRPPSAAPPTIPRMRQQIGGRGDASGSRGSGAGQRSLTLADQAAAPSSRIGGPKAICAGKLVIDGACDRGLTSRRRPRKAQAAVLSAPTAATARSRFDQRSRSTLTIGPDAGVAARSCRWRSRPPSRASNRDSPSRRRLGDGAEFGVQAEGKFPGDDPGTRLQPCHRPSRPASAASS
jgi:hypothetical protein